MRHATSDNRPQNLCPILQYTTRWKDVAVIAPTILVWNKQDGLQRGWASCLFGAALCTWKLHVPTKRPKRKARMPRRKTSEALGCPLGDGVTKTSSGEADSTGDNPPEGETRSDVALELPVVTDCRSLGGPVLGAHPPQFPESPAESAPGAVAVAATGQHGALEGSRSSSGGTLQKGRADGPMNVASNVETNDHSADFDIEPDSTFATGSADINPSNIGGQKSRFTGRYKPVGLRRSQGCRHRKHGARPSGWNGGPCP